LTHTPSAMENKPMQKQLALISSSVIVVVIR